jgi:ElaB/YqjD/DUF883 family membrane-anchored ribosome-binding protein
MTTHNHVFRAKHIAARAENEAQSQISRLRAEALARGQEVMNAIKDRGGDLLDEAQDRGRVIFDASKEWVSENPAQAVGIAFIAGLIAHAWFRRGDD